ncbi:MAG: hypothetical protein GDA66_05165 [Nitrospira sp. CR1.2]|nr:hypothetical protein [Nitrospira sp. CR1.2]
MLTYGSRSPLTATMHSAIIGLTFLGAMAVGCSTTTASVQQQTRQPQASVRLEEVADWEFEASHPSSLEIDSLQDILRAVVISEAPTDLSNLPVDGSKPMTVFSDEDVRYLAPLLAQALSQAQPEYVVAFRLSSSAGSGVEPTAGTLYVHSDRLYLTITEHQGTLQKVDSTWFGNGRPARVVSMAPASAGRIEQAMPATVQGKQQLKSLAIDYSLFAKNVDRSPAQTKEAVASAVKPAQAMAAPAMAAVLPEERPMSPRPATPAVPEATVAANVPPVGDDRMTETLQELQEVRDAMARKDAKINALRRDLESMRVQLETKDKELRAVKSTQQTQPRRENRNKAELIR